MWFPVPGMYGGFSYRLEVAGVKAKLVSESWCRVVGGSGQRHEITRTGGRVSCRSRSIRLVRFGTLSRLIGPGRSFVFSDRLDGMGFRWRLDDRESIPAAGGGTWRAVPIHFSTLSGGLIISGSRVRQ